VVAKPAKLRLLVFARRRLAALRVGFVRDVIFFASYSPNGSMRLGEGFQFAQSAVVSRDLEPPFNAQVVTNARWRAVGSS
jgi:hypothetical protein